jgi:hypothetical protein
MLIAMGHDQRFKTVIREFFADFLRLFFAAWAARLDLRGVEWLDKEMFPGPPEGARHALDLVARVPVASGASASTILLVHIEIEAPERTTALKPRLPYYYHYWG